MAAVACDAGAWSRSVPSSKTMRSLPTARGWIAAAVTAAGVAAVAWAAAGLLDGKGAPAPVTPGPVAEVETAVFGFG